MQLEIKELVESVIRNISKEYEVAKMFELDQLTRNELVSRILVAEATVKVLNEKIRVLEWENHVWNSSEALKIPRI